MYLGNSPASELVIRAEARKSFAIGIWVKDQNGRALDITGCTLRIVAKKLPLSSSDTTDADNLFTNDTAEILSPAVGYARFSLQASDLDHAPGEYQYSIVLLDGGYSSVIVRGTLEILVNTEFSSVDDSYASENPPTSLNIVMRQGNTVNVFTGPTLAPGTTSFTDGDKEKLDSIEAGAQVNVNADWNATPGSDAEILNKPDAGDMLPAGGSTGAVLIKASSGDGDAIWALLPTSPGGGALDATGVPDGYVPTANGVDSWDWAEVLAGVISVNGLSGIVVLSLDEIPDTATRLALTDAERTKIAALAVNPPWSSLTGVPAFGTAALEDVEAFLVPLGVSGADITSGMVGKNFLPGVWGLNGISRGTTDPSGGADNDLYFKYSV